MPLSDCVIFFALWPKKKSMEIPFFGGMSPPTRLWARIISCRDVRSTRLYMKFRAHTPLPPHAGRQPRNAPPMMRWIIWGGGVKIARKNARLPAIKMDAVKACFGNHL